MKHEGRGDDETTRSGLFFEAIRVISEMREFDRQRKGDVIDADIRPRFAIYENVEGAFSSNAGCDFQAVLTELIRVKEPDAPDVPLPEKGKWGRAGYLYDDMGKWSVAWLLHDAQYHGVAQRRKRVCVCADYGGLDAGRMLFEPELHRKAENPDRDEALADLGMGCAGEVSTLTSRLPRNSAAGGEAGQGPAPGTESRSGAAGDGAGRIYLMDSIGGQAESYAETDIANTLKATHYKCPEIVSYCLQNSIVSSGENAMQGGDGIIKDISFTLTTYGGSHAVAIEPGIAAREGGHYYDEVSGTLRANAGDNLMSVSQVRIPTPDAQGFDGYNSALTGDVEATLGINCGMTTGRNGVVVSIAPKAFCLQGNGIDRADTAGCNGKGWAEDVSYTINTVDRHAVRTAFAQNQRDEVRDLRDVAGSLAAEPGMKQQTFVAYAFDSLASNSMRSGNPVSGCRPVDVAKTLDTSSPDPSKNQGGIAILVERIEVNNRTSYQSTTGALMASGYDKLGTQEAMSDMYVVEQADKPVLVYDACGGGDGSVSPCIVGDHNNRVTDMTAIVIEPASTAYTLQISTDANPTISCEVFHCTAEEDLTGPLKARDYKDPMIVAVDCRNLAETPMSGTLQAKENGGQSLNYTNPVRVESIVRRLTPIECERLQYFPDNWSAVGILPDGSEKVMSDSTRYKLQGNSIARPFWRNLCARISSLYTQYTPTLGSLFDGQGGFPLCWAEINGPDACRWSSEIVEDAAAVTRKHFGDEDLGTKGDYYTAIKRQFMPLPIVGQAVTDKTSDKSKNQSMEGNAMIEIHVSLSASNLEDAINRLADALESTGIAAVPEEPKKRSRKKADVQPVAEAQPEVQPDSILPQPIVEPVVEPIAEPAIPETTYTRDQIARCGAGLIDKGQRAALLDILKQHGVRAIPQLPDDQTVLSAIAADLRALGGDI